jgi:hypothetical protein
MIRFETEYRTAKAREFRRWFLYDYADARMGFRVALLSGIQYAFEYWETEQERAHFERMERMTRATPKERTCHE